MIRFESMNYRSNRLIYDEWKASAPERFYMLCEGEELRLIRRDNQPAGMFVYCFADDKADLSVWFTKGTDDRKKLLAVICERLVRTYHPSIIRVPEPLENLSEVYKANSFVKNGDVYEKKIEPWRKILNDAVFDEEGFIINQGLMKEIPFGWFDTKNKGCGWIAGYNVLKMMGMETTMERCAKELEKGALLGGLMGENLFSLFLWLKKQGLDVSMSLPSNRNCVKKIRRSTCGVILYNHSRGAHYVTYRNLGHDNIQIYNAVYGKRSHVMKSADFMKKFALFPTSVVIAVRKGS